MRLLPVIVLLLLAGSTAAQSLGELEARRRQALEDIEYVDRMLKETANERKETIEGLSIVNSKLRLRENIIRGINEQITLLNLRIDLNRTAIELMQRDLQLLTSEYEKAILHAQRISKGQPAFAYIFSARDLNQGYKRMKYLQQVARYRRREAELIMELKGEIERKKDQLEKDLADITDLKKREEVQKSSLQKEQTNRQGLVNRLSRKQKELQQDLQKKRRIAEEIQREIERVIEEERKRRAVSDLTPEEKLVGDDFVKNMGSLPWPVERGIITARFGVHDHPVFKGTKVNNIGIDITSNTKVRARAIFKGSVVSVFGINGGNMAVIIRHGKYLTVYQNLVNVIVKPGDTVNTKQELGDVYSDTENGGKCVIKFMVYEEKDRKDPEAWLAKRD